MKQTLILIVLITFFFSNVQAGAIEPDSLSTIVNQGNSRIVAAIAKQSKEFGDTLRSFIKPLNAPVAPIEQSAFSTKSIAFMPLILFLLLLTVVAVKLKNDNVKLSEFLVDKDQQVEIKKEEVKAEVANATAQTAAANAIAVNAAAFQAAGIAPVLPAALTQANNAVTTEPPQSVSRLVVFISGITSIILAVCLTSFFMYRWSLGDTKVDFSNLDTILYGLGLGVLPYGFSKIAGAIK